MFIHNINKHKHKIMKTRSQTKKDLVELKRELPTEPTEVFIDFDEASKAWYANKKRMPNAMCKYICLGKTVKGTVCNNKPIQWQNYCCKHMR